MLFISLGATGLGPLTSIGSSLAPNLTPEKNLTSGQYAKNCIWISQPRKNRFMKNKPVVLPRLDDWIGNFRNNRKQSVTLNENGICPALSTIISGVPQGTFLVAI